VLLYDIHDIDRFPTAQDVVSSCRLGKCAKASAGKRLGTSGKNIGNAHLTWAFSEAAALCLRHNPAGQKYLARLEKKHPQGKALTILAHQLARAVYYMLQHQTAFHRAKFLPSEGSRVGEPHASLDTQGMSLDRAYTTSYVASTHRAVDSRAGHHQTHPPG
jgi:transposase IS116/IS110/IS902 family protein